MTKKRTNSQHYVPRFYLRGFEIDGGLWAYDKLDGRIFKTGVEGVAVGNRFYDLAPDVLKDDKAQEFNDKESGEKITHVFEKELREALDWLEMEGPEKGIPDAKRRQIGFAITLQYLRTKCFRYEFGQQIQSVVTDLAQELVKLNFPNADPNQISGGIEDDVLTVLHLRGMLDDQVWRTVTEPMIQHSWILGTAPVGDSFITSDSPVSRRAHLGSSSRQSCGFRSEGIEIVFPISSRHILIIAERAYHAGLGRLDGRAIQLQPNNVRYYNRLIASNCDRMIFGDRRAFNDIHLFFQANPELRTQRWASWITESDPPYISADGEMRQITETFLKPIDVNWTN